jgi:hypothetical protein
MVISGVISVCIGFKEWREIDGIDAEFLHMRNEVQNMQKPVF